MPVTRKGVRRVDGRIRSPGTATYTAKNVPFVNPTRRQVGGNAAALGASLQRFSTTIASSLGHLARDQQKEAKAARELSETRQAVNDKANGNPGYQGDAGRRETIQFKLGKDFNLQAAKNDSDFLVNTLPNFDKQLSEWSAAEANNNFRLPDKEGNRHEIDTYSEDHLKARAQSLNAEIDKLPEDSAEAKKYKQILYKRVATDLDKNSKLLKKAQVNIRRGQYYANSGIKIKENLFSLQAMKVPAKDAWKAVTDYEKDIVSNRLYNVGNKSLKGHLTAKQRTEHILRTFHDDPSLATDPAKARYIIGMIDGGKVQGTALRSHPTYGGPSGLATKLYKKAEDTVAVARTNELKVATTKGIVEALGKKHPIGSLNVQDIKYGYGYKSGTGLRYTKTVTAKEMKDAAVEQLEAGIRNRMPEGSTLKDLIGETFNTFSGLGIVSPKLRAQVEGVNIHNPNPAELDEKLKGLVTVWDAAVETGNGTQLNDLFKGNKELKETIQYIRGVRAFDANINLGEEGAAYLTSKENPGASFHTIKLYKDGWEKFEQKISKDGAEAQDYKTLEKMAQVYFEHKKPNASEFRKYLQHLWDGKQERRIAINGHKTAMPSQVAVPEVVKGQLEYLIGNSDKMRELMNLAPKESWMATKAFNSMVSEKDVKFKWVGDGFMAMDGKTNRPLRNGSSVVHFTPGQLAEAVNTAQKLTKAKNNLAKAAAIRKAQAGKKPKLTKEESADFYRRTSKRLLGEKEPAVKDADDAEEFNEVGADDRQPTVPWGQ